MVCNLAEGTPPSRSPPSILLHGLRTTHQLLTASPPVDVVVAKDGSGDHDTISAAVAAAPPGGSRYIIHIKEGLYQEKVEVLQRSNVMLIGDGAARTEII
ncbi:pectinesterase 3 [Triticum aestivum]|uniref:pectinesterase 3-like n=1 Tax=Triticum aestivum TaxID=4565 RepID=UPI001D01C048|nr:pectinesterase 3-like [Triticum aestivum]XP_044372221.1 pectinesterase 3-like [Triticum aestivum]